MATANITKSLLDGIERPKSGTTRIMDTKLQGFGVDVGKRRVTFFARRWADGKTHKEKVGEWPAVTVQEAREKALKVLGQIGGVIERKRAPAGPVVPTLKEAIDAYLTFRETSGKAMKPSTAADYRSRLKHLDGISDMLITEVTRSVVTREHKRLTVDSGTVSANVVMRYLGAVLNWASVQYSEDDEKPLIAVSPIKSMRKMRQWNPERRRQTFLDDKLFKLYWKVVSLLPKMSETYVENAEVAADLFRLISYVGMRPGEAARLHVKNVDLERRVFVLKDTKNGRDFWIPFAEPVADILKRRIEYAKLCDSEFVFPSSGRRANTGEEAKRKFVTWTKQKDDIKANIPGWMPTDLRRTITTLATNMRFSSLVVKRLLNHTTERVEGDVTAGYYVSDVEYLREPVADIARQINRMAQEAEDELRRELAEGDGLPQWLRRSSPRGRKPQPQRQEPDARPGKTARKSRQPEKSAMA